MALPKFTKSECLKMAQKMGKTPYLSQTTQRAAKRAYDKTRGVYGSMGPKAVRAYVKEFKKQMKEGSGQLSFSAKQRGPLQLTREFVRQKEKELAAQKKGPSKEELKRQKNLEARRRLRRAEDVRERVKQAEGVLSDKTPAQSGGKSSSTKTQTSTRPKTSTPPFQQPSTSSPSSDRVHPSLEKGGMEREEEGQAVSPPTDAVNPSPDESSPSTQEPDDLPID